MLLLHDTSHGAEVIAMTARLGRGLPGRVLPFAVNEVTQVGLDFLAAALAYGAAGVSVLVDGAKSDELTGLAQQVGLAETVMEGLGYGGGGVCGAFEPLYGWTVEMDTFFSAGLDPTEEDHVSFHFDGDVAGYEVYAAVPDMEDDAWHEMVIEVEAPR